MKLDERAIKKWKSHVQFVREQVSDAENDDTHSSEQQTHSNEQHTDHDK